MLAVYITIYYRNFIIKWIASRLCYGKDMWEEPNMNNCSTLAITENLEDLNDFVRSNSTDAEMLVALTERLVNITTTERAIFPTDLRGILDAILRFDTFAMKMECFVALSTLLSVNCIWIKSYYATII